MKPKIVENVSIDDMLKGVDQSVDQLLGEKSDTEVLDLERAGNIIEWIIGAKFLGQPQLFEYKRQYQILRDFFQIRCPICNPQGEEDTWDKGKEYLEK